MAEPTVAEMIAWCEELAKIAEEKWPEDRAVIGDSDAAIARAIAARLRQTEEGR